jgi:hypothetical protein
VNARNFHTQVTLLFLESSQLTATTAMSSVTKEEKVELSEQTPLTTQETPGAEGQTEAGQQAAGQPGKKKWWFQKVCLLGRLGCLVNEAKSPRNQS